MSKVISVDVGNLPESWLDFVAQIYRERNIDVDSPKFSVTWLDDQGDEVVVCNEKTFQTFLKMSSGKLIIKSEEKTPIKVHFDLAERKEVVYSFAETFKTLLEDIDGCFRIGFPNTDYRIYWTDSDGDNFNIVNEKGFELFLKYGGSKLYISRKNAPTPAESSGPIKVSVNQKGDFHREYINYVANWNSLLKEIQSTFDLVFAGIDYRMFWRDADNDEVDIYDDSSLYVFLEKSKEVDRRIYIVEKPRTPNIKVCFTRALQRNQQVFYWNPENYSSFLKLMKINLRIDPKNYMIIPDGKEENIKNAQDFEKFLKSPGEKKIFIRSADDLALELPAKVSGELCE